MAATRITLSTGIKLDVPDLRTTRPDLMPRFVISIRKSGSTMVTYAARLIADELGLGFLDVGDLLFNSNISGSALWSETALNELIQPGVLYAGFRDFPLAMEKSPLFRAAPRVIFVRDPRDALVSEYFSNAFSHRIPAGVGMHTPADLMPRLRAEALQSDLANYVLMRSADFVRTAEKFFPALRRGDPVLRYEDLIFDKPLLISRLSTLLDLPLPQPATARIAKSVDLRPAVEDPHAFVRKVTPGDHREKLSGPTITELSRRVGGVMAAFGYG